jgi:hypothetical protein
MVKAPINTHLKVSLTKAASSFPGDDLDALSIPALITDGPKVPSHQFRIRSLRVGNKTIPNVIATVASVNADILLGQSFLSKFQVLVRR